MLRRSTQCSIYGTERRWIAFGRIHVLAAFGQGTKPGVGRCCVVAFNRTTNATRQWGSHYFVDLLHPCEVGSFVEVDFVRRIADSGEVYQRAARERVSKGALGGRCRTPSSYLAAEGHHRRCRPTGSESPRSAPSRSTVVEQYLR